MTALDERESCAQDLREYPEGTVYIGHLDGGLADTSHAKHYTGHADPGQLADRWAQHGTSDGARILEVQRERGGTWHWVATFPGTRDTERAFKDTRNITRYCPDCTAEPYQKIPPIAPRRVRENATWAPGPRSAGPLPRLPAPPPAEQGRRAGERFVATREGWSADRVAAALEYVTGPYRAAARHTDRAAQEMAAFTATVTAAIEAQRATERAQAAPAAQPQEGTHEVSTDTTQAQPGGPGAQQALEWVKGAQTAHDLIVRQVEAGQDAEAIAARWDEALATYDDATATGAEREWRAGAEETARDMIQTWRDMERAEAEQAQAGQDAREAAELAVDRRASAARAVGEALSRGEPAGQLLADYEQAVGDERAAAAALGLDHQEAEPAQAARDARDGGKTCDCDYPACRSGEMPSALQEPGQDEAAQAQAPRDERQAEPELEAEAG